MDDTYVNAGGYDTNPRDIRSFYLKLGIGCKIKSSFNTSKFFNCLAEHHEFISKVIEAWEIERKSGLK